MNGRVYDPNLGRFLSVDPVFQFPTNTQSLNPYSYVLNNCPVRDPSGYAASDCDAGGNKSCDISDVKASDINSVQKTANGQIVVNTKEGSFAVNSVTGTTKNSDGSTTTTAFAFNGNGYSKASLTEPNGAILGARADDAQHTPSTSADIGAPKADGNRTANTGEGTKQLEYQGTDPQNMTSEERGYTQTLDNRINVYGQKLMNAFIENAAIGNWSVIPKLAEGIGAFNDTHYIYSTNDDGGNYAVGGLYHDNSTGQTIRQVTFFRSSQNIMYEGEKAPPGYSLRFRKGIGGLDDLIAHESGHTMYSNMFSSFTDWNNYTRYNFKDREHIADSWAEFMRDY